MLCRQCGANVPEGSSNCSLCGAPMSVAMGNTSCPACGAPLTPGVKFCGTCGATIAQTAPAESNFADAFDGMGEKVKSLTSDKKKMGIIIGAVVAVVVIAVILVFVLGGRGAGSAEDVADAYMEAMSSGDMDDLMDLLPEEVYDIAMEDVDSDDLEEMEDYLKEMMSEIDFSWDISDTTKVKGDELDEIQETYEDEYDLEVSSAKVVEIEITTEMGGDDYTSTQEILTVEIDGTWYLDVDSMDF